MGKIIKLVVAVAVIGALALLLIRFLASDEDAWICDGGAWTRHGNPTAPSPEGPCGG